MEYYEEENSYIVSKDTPGWICDLLAYLADISDKMDDLQEEMKAQHECDRFLAQIMSNRDKQKSKE